MGSTYIKKLLAHAVRLCASLGIAALCFDGIAWLGIKYHWIYTLVQTYGSWLFVILLYLMLYKAYRNFGSWKRKDILWERFAVAPENFSQMLLDDAENVMLMRDDREKKVRTYRNLVSGDLIVTTYDVPLRKQKNRRNLHASLRRLRCRLDYRLCRALAIGIRNSAQHSLPMDTMYPTGCPAYKPTGRN